MKFGLLTNVNPILGLELKKLFYENKIYFDVIIVDMKETTSNDIDIHDERTNYKYPVHNIYKTLNKNENVIKVKNHNDLKTYEIIKKNKLDFLINGFTPRILKNQILGSTSNGILNCHPGILPNFRGCMAVEWSIFYDYPVGNTIHWMNELIDEGPILQKKVTTILPNMSYEDIRTKVQFDGFKLMVKTVQDIIKGKIDISGKKQTSGNYHKPMSESQFQFVQSKIRNGKYKNE